MDADERLRVGEEMAGIPVGRDYAAGEVNLCCPACGYFHCHVGAPLFIPRDEAWGRRDGYLSIPVSGECGHRWVITITQHKGREVLTTCRVYDERD